METGNKLSLRPSRFYKKFAYTKPASRRSTIDISGLLYFEQFELISNNTRILIDTQKLLLRCQYIIFSPSQIQKHTPQIARLPLTQTPNIHTLRGLRTNTNMSLACDQHGGCWLNDFASCPFPYTIHIFTCMFI